MKKHKQLNEQEMKDQVKRLNKLFEYSFVNKEEDLLLDEDDDQPDLNAEPAPTPDAEQGVPPPAEGGEIPTANPAQPEQGMQPDLNVEIPAPEAAPVAAPVEPVSSDIEIDVTDLTTKQDDIALKVDALTNQTTQAITNMADLTAKLEAMINSTSAELNTIKDEVVKRNPTNQEILQKRVVVSDPFNQTPADYWAKKESEGQYKLEDDDNQNPPSQEFVLTNKDVNNANPLDIYKSFGLGDDEINQSLGKILNF